MPEIHLKELETDLKQGKIYPVYLLQGDEPWLIDKAEAFIRQYTVDPATRDFNYTLIYGKDASPGQILETCYRYPVMAERQVVVVREAQSLKEIETLGTYIAKAPNTTVLVLVHKHKKLDGRTQFAKNIGKTAAVLTSMKLKDKDVTPWIRNYAAHEGKKIDEDAVELIFNSLGNDLSALMNSMEKLMINLADEKVITREHVHRFVGIHRAYNAFELNNALGVKNAKKVYEIVKYFEANPKAHALEGTIGVLNALYTKMLITAKNSRLSDKELGSIIGTPPYYVKDYRAMLKHYDLRQIEAAIYTLSDFDLRKKGFYRVSDQGLLRELVGRLMS